MAMTMTTTTLVISLNPSSSPDSLHRSQRSPTRHYRPLRRSSPSHDLHSRSGFHYTLGALAEHPFRVPLLPRKRLLHSSEIRPSRSSLREAWISGATNTVSCLRESKRVPTWGSSLRRCWSGSPAC
ncbi:hypothetical protein M407DRAFT_177482 [Tulasnella calospora MUT 4182]|uniref:Uncharacterized protein n=1 Tax=Tulasnella calospora MUT 4182 TaxID=1051891 RepID=A0A0C3MJ85_9AGAM|nr:hypothetical protein M407DRAFT_177482 [Tulasnella calospora MUT 4182]